MDDDQIETYNRLQHVGAACKPLTILQKALLRQLADAYVLGDDSVATASFFFSNTNKVSYKYCWFFLN